MPLFDTHTHIYLSEKKSQEEIIKQIQDDPNIKYIATIGLDEEVNKNNIILSKNYPFIIPSIGIHPCYVEWYNKEKEQTLENLETLIKTEKIYALWECWLDYYRLPPRLTETSFSKEELVNLQKYFFKWQIELAKLYRVPLIIHNREAKEDILKILIQHDYKNFVFHCYSEDLSFAEEILSFAPDAFISFSGIVTFKNSKQVQETAAKIPLKNILTETDCPYLSPEPKRWQENYPENVAFVLKKIQSLREESPEEVEKTIYENSLRFFWISS